MTWFRYAVVCLLLAVLAIGAGCSSNSTNPGDGDGNGNNNPPGGTNGKITMTINGTAWESDVATASGIRQNTTLVSVGIGSGKLSGDAFAFAVADLAGVGTETYTAGGVTSVVNATFVAAGDTALSSTLDPFQPVGQISISELNETDGYISGTFSFDMVRSDSTVQEFRSGTFTRIMLSIQ